MYPFSSLFMYILLFLILYCNGIVPQFNSQTGYGKVYIYERNTREELFLIVPQNQFSFLPLGQTATSRGDIQSPSAVSMPWGVDTKCPGPFRTRSRYLRDKVPLHLRDFVPRNE